MSPTWDEIWASRSIDASGPTSLMGLMRADGLDTGFGSVSEQNWLAGVRRVADELHLAPGSSVYEVGCGAGAFLYDLYQQGLDVGGLDRSAALIDCARRAMPGGRFVTADASELDATERADTVVSFGVLMYFPSLDYARSVIETMVRKARGSIALLDIPDLDRMADAIGHRIKTVGGPAAYAERYTGLDHLYFARSWIVDVLGACGVVDVHVADQWIAGYENAAYRFNAWGVVPAKTSGSCSHS